jgi:[Skp1-protein]-hydroxyproline N-acetylglucosaminyltransferase
MVKIRTIFLLSVIFLCVLILVCVGKKEMYTGAPDPSTSQTQTIFVSCASYRDHQCMETIRNMYKRAKFPARIFVGICEQNTTDARESCTPSEFKYHSNIRRLTIPHSEAKGPTYARYLCSTLYRGETFFMQIDSHTTFARDWDIKAIRNLAACPSKKAVLTGYPHDVSTYGIDEKSVPLLCTSKWNDDGLPQFEAAVKSKQDLDTKQNWPVPFTAGGFVFGPGSMVAEVPFDPNLDHLFQGEEVLYTVRLWTSGYDFFSSKENIVFHAYTRKDEPKFWEDVKDWSVPQKKSALRARRILGLEEPSIAPGADPYGLGNARTLAEYWKFAELDPASKTSKSKEKFC